MKKLAKNFLCSILLMLTLSAVYTLLLGTVAADFSHRDKRVGNTEFSILSGTVTVHGYCYYEDDSNSQHPIKYATVNLWDKTWYGVPRLLSTTSTNSLGYYTFGPISNVDEPGGSGTLDLYIEVVCDSDAVKVVPILPINVWPYAGSSDVIWDVPDGTISIDYTYDDSSTKGCWGIYDSILMAYQKTADTQGYYPRKITVVWPWIGTQFGDMWIFQYIGIESGYEWNRDAVLHEYGHWIMHCLYQGNVPSVDYGSDGVHYWDSHETPATAWVEGWASFYACAVQDDRYFVLGSDTYDLESQQPKGDDVEGAIACILWDIYDSANDGNDTLSMDLSPIWDVLASYVPGHHVSSIHEFWNGWFARGNDQSQKMSAIFNDHGVPENAASLAVISEVNYPYYVTIGSSIDIIITGENLAGQADEGYVQISFPDNPSKVSILASNASHSKIYWPGDQLWAGYGQYKINATYPHVEAWDAPWPSGNSRYLEIDATPMSAGVFTFYVKMTVGSGGVWYADPSIDGSESSLKDEQNEYVLSHTINVSASFNIVWNNQTYSVDVISNSSISDFSFNQGASTLSFNVTGTSGTMGFCRVAIPKTLMSCADLEDWVVTVNGTQVLPPNLNITTDANYTYVHFSYHQSTEAVQIQSSGVVPEFQPLMLLPLFIMITLLTATVSNRRFSHKSYISKQAIQVMMQYEKIFFDYSNHSCAFMC
jgi:hypothetical protein